jgi:hypothetical protein
MATQKNFLDDEQDQGMQQGQSLESSAVGGGPQAASSNVKGNQQGTGWQNLSTYLDMNQGQGAGVATGITKKSQDDIDSATSNAQAWADAAKGRVDQGTKQDTWSSQINSDPTKVDANAFNAWRSAADYTGPVNAQADTGYGSVYGQVQKSNQAINNIQNYDTQKALAQETFGKNGRYTGGMGTLDTFIMRGDQSGKDALQGFQTRNAGFSKDWDKTVEGVDTYAKGAGARGKSAVDSANKVVNDKYAAMSAKAQADAQAKLKAERDALQSGVLQQYLDAGISDPNSGMLANTVTTRGVNMADGLNDADLAALNALSGLDMDTATNALTRDTSPIASANRDLVAKNIADYQYATRAADMTPSTEGDFTVTPVDGIRYNPDGSVATGETEDDLYNRILGGFSGV